MLCAPPILWDVYIIVERKPDEWKQDKDGKIEWHRNGIIHLSRSITDEERDHLWRSLYESIPRLTNSIRGSNFVRESDVKIVWGIVDITDEE